MKKLITITLFASLAFTSCDTIKNLPTNTSGGFFSLNGAWTLNAASDNALVGSVITVYPIAGNATVNSLSNNTNCVRERDALWKDIQSASNGSFSLNALASNCNNSILYKSAVITVINNDEIRLSTQNTAGNQVLQTWLRVKK